MVICPLCSKEMRELNSFGRVVFVCYPCGYKVYGKGTHLPTAKERGLALAKKEKTQEQKIAQRKWEEEKAKCD